MIDVGAIWGTDIEEASKRSKLFKDNNITWLEEPFTQMRIMNMVSFLKNPTYL